MQTVIAQINHAIGAAGVVSQECKAVVEQYGQIIMHMLFSEASSVCGDIFFPTDCFIS